MARNIARRDLFGSALLKRAICVRCFRGVRMPMCQRRDARHLLQLDRHPANMRPYRLPDRAAVNHANSAADYSAHRDDILRARAGAQSPHQSVRMAARLPMSQPRGTPQ